jgi:hypothetical protein
MMPNWNNMVQLERTKNPIPTIYVGPFPLIDF